VVWQKRTGLFHAIQFHEQMKAQGRLGLYTGAL
jgi:hypothetical protein